ncbi:MAG: hypothetical protein R3212_05930 [Xanthomonadales bacterium]|nr:hypothetical protein [Xanthomonadales bacterium]
MHITLHFCEEAESRPDGKLDIRGIFNELYAPGFPAKQDRLMIAGVIEWERHVDGRQAFVLHLNDPDGSPIYTIDGYTDVDTREDGKAPARTHLCLALENVIFPVAGEYRQQIVIGDETIPGPVLYLLRTKTDQN